MAKILVVDDDREMAEFISDGLCFENHTVEISFDGSDGSERLAVQKYDLIILDRGLPGLDGLEICRNYRAKGGVAPVLMLTGKTKVAERAEGLDSGADDYLVKPFHLDELRARVRALLRRGGAALATDVLVVGAVSLDPKAFRVTTGGNEVKLVPKEFALLEFLMRNSGQVFSADAIISRVWTINEEASPETIRTYVKNLRKKLTAEGEESIIHTVHGFGYKAEAL